MEDAGVISKRILSLREAWEFYLRKPIIHIEEYGCIPEHAQFKVRVFEHVQLKVQEWKMADTDLGMLSSGTCSERLQYGKNSLRAWPF